MSAPHSPGPNLFSTRLGLFRENRKETPAFFRRGSQSRNHRTPRSKGLEKLSDERPSTEGGPAHPVGGKSPERSPGETTGRESLSKLSCRPRVLGDRRRPERCSLVQLDHASRFLSRPKKKNGRTTQSQESRTRTATVLLALATPAPSRQPTRDHYAPDCSRKPRFSGSFCPMREATGRDCYRLRKRKQSIS